MLHRKLAEKHGKPFTMNIFAEQVLTRQLTVGWRGEGGEWEGERGYA